MFRDQSVLTWLVWLALLGIAADALLEQRFSIAFIALATLALSLAPVFVARWAEIHVPPSFMLAVVLFVGGTLFLGEVYDFYGRFWWWDIAMHGGSALGFGLIGFVLMFMVFQGHHMAAPHGALAFFAFCFAVAIGAGWEVFEFSMDQLFGLNMQKSGLVDTMTDLIVDIIGALFGALAGYAYLKGRQAAGLQRLIGEFIERNPRLFPPRGGRAPGAWSNRAGGSGAPGARGGPRADGKVANAPDLRGRDTQRTGKGRNDRADGDDGNDGNDGGDRADGADGDDGNVGNDGGDAGGGGVAT